MIAAVVRRGACHDLRPRTGRGDRRAPPVAGRPRGRVLARIERLEPRLHAFVSVNAANARLAAEAVDKAIRAGHAVGPLHGIPIAIKDLVEIEGDVAMGGTAAWRNRIAPHTATLVRRLMAAGMINLGSNCEGSTRVHTA